MARILGGIVAVLLLIAAVGAIYVYGRVNSIESERVTDDVHMISGLGGNVGVLRTEIGAVVVDTMTFRMQGDRIRERAEQLVGGPVQVVINTHYHLDHTHGNPAFPAQTRVVSTKRTLEHLRHFDGAYWEGAAAERLPNETFTERHEMKIGGKTIRSYHLGRGHTDGDLVVLFVEDRVLHTGDLVFNGRYPNIDLEAGGSVRAWDGTIERMLGLDFDRVIPGHGPVTDREGLRDYQRFVRQLWSVAERAAKEGQSLAKTQATAELTADAGFETMVIPFVMRLDREFVLRRAWEEATGAVKPPGEGVR